MSLQEVWNALFCPFCNAVIEAETEEKAHEALANHQRYVQCIKGY
jgi:hypothetical protein